MYGEKLLLRVSDAAELLSISRTTAYELVRRGVIPSITLGTRIRVPMLELESTIADRVREFMNERGWKELA